MKKIYEGNLTVSNNEKLVVDYTEITGYVYVNEGATLQADILTTIGGYVSVYQGATLQADVLTTIGGDVYVREGVTLQADALTTIGGYMDVYKGATLKADVLTTIGGNVYVCEGATLQADALTTIGGSVYVREEATLQADALTTIGGYVYVRKGATLQADALTTIGDYVDVSEEAILVPRGLQGNNPAAKEICSKLKRNGFITPDGKYIIADGILSKLVSHHANVYKIKHIVRDEVQYLITDGNGNYAHGATIEEAHEDLIFKITDRTKSDYEGLKGNDVLSYADSVRCYRVVTGACSAGTRSFVENVLGSNKKSEYSIEEIAKLTKGQYGNESFCKFFKI